MAVVQFRPVLPPVPGRAVLVLAFGVAAAVSTANCATTPPDPSPPEPAREVALGQEFALRAADAVRVAGTDLRVTFDRVTEDSRCPTNVNCVWAGNAVVRLDARVGQAPRGPLDLHTTTADKRDATVDGYRVHLVGLTPARTEGQTISQDQYIATVIVRSR